MRIFLHRLGGEMVEMDIDSGASLADLKCKIQEPHHEELDSSFQNVTVSFVLGERVLEDDDENKSLQEHGVVDGVTLMFIKRTGITPGAEYTIILDKTAGTRLGIDVDNQDGETLLIEYICAGGLVPEWNESHPDEQVKVGDRIVEVNEIRGDLVELIEELKKNTMLKIKLFREPKSKSVTKNIANVPGPDPDMRGYNTSGIALVDALAEEALLWSKLWPKEAMVLGMSIEDTGSNDAIGEDGRSPPAVAIPDFPAQDVSQTGLDGIWRDREHGHLIKDTRLTWADDTWSDLTITEGNGPVTVMMEFNGQQVVGTLNDSATVLDWSDGDKWFRITLDGFWDDSGHYHYIDGTMLRLSIGSACTLTLGGWNSVSMIFNETTVQGYLERSGDRIWWKGPNNNTYIWLRAGLDGTWQDRNEQHQANGTTKAHSIVGTTMMHASGKQILLTRLSRTKFIMDYNGRTPQAQLDELGKELLWDDGEVWSRVQKAHD